jgi:hypothetical protein
MLCTVTESTASAPPDPSFRARTGGDDRMRKRTGCKEILRARGPVLNAAPQEEHVTPLKFASAAFASLPRRVDGDAASQAVQGRLPAALNPPALLFSGLAIAATLLRG